MADLIPLCHDSTTGAPTRPSASDTIVATDGTTEILLSPVADYIEYNNVGSGSQNFSNATTTVINFTNQVTDSDSNYSSNTYTVPEDGHLFIHVSAHSADVSPSWASTENVELLVYVNGSISRRMGWQWGGQGSNGQVITGSAALTVSSSDTVDVRLRHTSGGNAFFGPLTSDAHFIIMALLR